MSISKHLMSTLGLATIFCSAPASAVTYTLNLTQSGAFSPFVYQGAVVGNTVTFINAATGNSSIPGFSLLSGDVLNVSVQLSSSITLPAGNDGYIRLGISPATGQSTSLPNQGYYSQTVTYFSNNVSIPAPSQLNYYIGSGGSLALGGATFGPAPAFTFDRVNYVMTMRVEANNSFAVGNGGNATASLGVYNLTPVPEPASASLLLAGLLAVGVGAARRRQAALHAVPTLPGR